MLKTMRGVTLVELLISIVVLSVLAVLAVPSFAVWMRNSQVRTAADAVLNGMQLARAEAIRRNKSVTFALTDRSGWVVRQVNPQLDLQQRSADEGSSKVFVAAAPERAYAITFDTMGGRRDNPDGSLPIETLEFTSLGSADSAVRPLRIVVGVSGSSRLCDPDPKLSASDPRRCTS